MKLLTPDEVKTDKTRSEEERVKHIEKLKDEESVLNQRVNIKRSSVDDEIATLDAELENHRKSVESKKAVLDGEIATKTAEVKSLEKRREEAVAPLYELVNKVNADIASVAERESALVERSESLDRASDDLSVLLEDVTDQRTQNDERTEELDRREKKIIEAENRTKESSETLSGKWLAFHKEVHETNRNLERREKKVLDREKANNSFASSLSVKETDLAHRETRLADGYATLERSKREIAEGKRPKS